MAPVFAHGRLRLYLLKLLDEAPRHGYEVIRLLEERFRGLYAPSAGTVYPRLAKLETEGLVRHTSEGGRKVYSLTDAGRAELADRSGELADLEVEIRESVAELAAEIREDVRGSASDLRREMREATAQARTDTDDSGRERRAGARARSKYRGGPWGDGESWGDRDAWHQAREELRRAKDEWQEQARRAKEESRRARHDAQRARRQAKDAQDFAREELQRLVGRVQDQTQSHVRNGDWATAFREGLAEVSRGMGRFSRPADAEGEPSAPGAAPPGAEEAAPAAPRWAQASDALSKDPGRDLERLLDQFRDDIRDVARDQGVTAEQLADVRQLLAHTAIGISGTLGGSLER